MIQYNIEGNAKEITLVPYLLHDLVNLGSVDAKALHEIDVRLKHF